MSVASTAVFSPRRIIATACVVSAASITITATTSYIYDPVAQTFGLSSDQTQLLKFVPSLSTILVVFVAGVLGDRIGRRRVITYGSVVYLIGAIIAAAAPSAAIAALGLSLLGAGASVMVVVSLALLSSGISGKDDRARAFGTLGLMGPVVYLIAPIIAGAMVTWGSWRMVVLLWLALGLAAVIAARRLLPPDAGNPQAGEMLTPILAGVVVALATETLSLISDDGLLSGSALRFIILTALTIAILWFANRRMVKPTLSFAPLRRPNSVLLLVATIIIPLLAMWYTTYLAFEYLFGLTPLQISLIMIPAQFAGMLGAKLAPRLTIARSLRFSGVVFYLLLAACELAFVIVGVNGMWAMTILVTLYSLLSSSITVVMSNAVMDSAPKDESGAIAAFRSASSRIGGALAAIVVGSVVLGTYQTSLNSEAATSGIAVSEVDQIAQSLTSDTGSTDPSSQGAYSATDVAEVSELQQQAMVDALHAKGVVGAVLALGAAGVFIVAMRRRPDHEDALAG